MRCVISHQSLFGVCMVVRMHAFLSICMSQHDIRISNAKHLNVIQTGKHQQSNDDLMLLPDFKDHENCNAMSSFTVLRHVPWNTFICSAVQCFHQFVMVFIYCLLSCVMVSIYCLLSFLVMQQITNTVSLLKFQQNVQTFQDHYN